MTSMWKTAPMGAHCASGCRCFSPSLHLRGPAQGNKGTTIQRALLFFSSPAPHGAQCQGRAGHRPMPLLWGAGTEDGKALCTKRQTVSCP